MAFTQITDGIDWQAASFINEIIKGFNERMPANTATSQGDTIDLVEVGDDVQLRNFWSTIQERIENQWDNSTTCTTSGGSGQISMRWITPDTVLEYEADPSFFAATMPSWDDYLESKTDMSDSGWRRASNWDPDVDDWANLADPMWSRAGNGFGRMENGDIIGPWIFDDLQRALDGMDTRYMSGSYTAFARGRSRVGQDSDYLTAIANFNAASVTADVIGQFLSRASFSYNDVLGQFVFIRRAPIFGLYQTNAVSDESLANPATLANGAGGADILKVYLWTRATGTYDANNDGVVEHQVQLAAQTRLDEQTENVFDIISVPNSSNSTSDDRGYVAEGSRFVVKFNLLEYTK